MTDTAGVALLITGCKKPLHGDLHRQGDAIAFYTERKAIMAQWTAQ